MTDLKPRLTAAVLVQKDNKFLLARRNKVNAFGKWVIPGGGVDFGETTKDAALRELKEETNLDVEIIKSLGPQEVINVPGMYHSVVFFYLAIPVSDNLRASDDVSEVEFFTIEQIKELLIVQSVRDVLEQAGFWK